MEYVKNNKGIILLIIGFLGLIIYNWDKISIVEGTTPQEFSEVELVEEITSQDDSSYIMVDIKGEVVYPGLYQIEDYKRVGQLIDLAGGPTENADLSEIGEAQFLEDGMTITIPSIEETQLVIPTDIVRIKVEIKGEVNFPGIYELYENARVEDLVEAAGGYKETADLETINQVEILSDGDIITIPKCLDSDMIENDSEKLIYVEITGNILNPGIYLIPDTFSLQDLIYEAGGVTPACDLTKIDWSITLCLGATIYIPGYDDEIVLEADNDKININTADLEALMDLTGIGQIIGQRIIDYRTEHGDFQCIADIMFVSGVKDSVYEEIKESITV